MVYLLEYIYHQEDIVSYNGYITVHGLDEGHTTPYKDMRFNWQKANIIMKSLYKLLQLIFEETATILTKIKRENI